jgi:HD superfamily phosphodiesterase
MSVIDLLSIKNPITLLSGLFHDLGKSCIVPTDNPSLPRFPGHALASANITEHRLKKWQASSYLIDRVVRLVSTHMYDISNATREKTIRKFIAAIGRDNVENWFVLRIADSCSYANQRKHYSHIIKSFEKEVTLYLKQQPNTDQPKFSSPGNSGTMRIKGGDA